jgi:hypothetical protein
MGKRRTSAEQLSFFPMTERIVRRAGRRKPLLPSGPNKRTIMHCQSLCWPCHTLCYEREVGGIEYPDSFQAKCTRDPRLVDCKHCLSILQSTSLYNLLLNAAKHGA